MKKGLIMEGGAMRGLFTCGILDVFMEEGVTFDGAVGVSAGAVFGCNFKSGQIGRVLRYNKKYCQDDRYASFKSLIRTGNFYGEEFCYHEIPEKLDPFDNEAFEKNPMAFYVAATNVKTGKAVYHRCRTGKAEDLLWMRASASIPIFSQVVEIGDYRLLDGGVGDSIPVRFMEYKGYDRNVVILTQPRNYQKKKNPYLPAARIILKEYPEMLRAMENRHLRYNQTLEYIRKREAEGELLVLCPPLPLEVGSSERDPDELQRVYDIGRVVGKRNLDKVRTYLAG